MKPSVFNWGNIKLPAMTIEDNKKCLFATAAERWSAVVRRDLEADEKFYYGVLTTGVLCRPSCSSRLALQGNVRFFDTYATALSAGFRPCKRCKPDQPSLIKRYAMMVANTCQLIEAAVTAPSLDSLAKAAGMSRYHFQRVFKVITGVTPKAYAVAHRTALVRQKLNDSNTVTDVIYAAGFNANSRFYATSNQFLGMTPSHFRKGGANIVIRFAVGESSLGAILVAASDKGICAISLGDDAELLLRNLQDQFPHADLKGGDAEFEGMIAQVIGFVETPAIGLNLPLDVQGTLFQQRVWQALRQIPVGSTASYSEIAARIGSAKAVRAVAQACAANVIAVAIPCHRVVRSDGSVSGYRWGVERKHALLLREKVK